MVARPLHILALLALVAVGSQLTFHHPALSQMTPVEEPMVLWGPSYVAQASQHKIWILDKKNPQGLAWEGSLSDTHPQWRWSPDGSKLAILEIAAVSRLRVWSRGGVLAYTGNFLDSEGAMQMEFSQDNSLLALRVARVYGQYDFDIGRVHAVNLNSGVCRDLTQSARRMRWLGHKLEVWAIKECEPPNDSAAWPLKRLEFQL